MWSALRGGALSSSHSAISHRWKDLASSSPILSRNFSSSAVNSVEKNKELLSLAEVEKTLQDVRADDVTVITAPKGSEFPDYMVIATGRSPWHVRNISQALIYQAGSLDLIPTTRACGCLCVKAKLFNPLEWAMLLHGEAWCIIFRGWSCDMAQNAFFEDKFTFSAYKRTQRVTIVCWILCMENVWSICRKVMNLNLLSDTSYPSRRLTIFL